tara:strand:- start:693 stop:2180 length:1488 start_codon:yes stop_codon:yes gene_type:complete
VLKTYLIAAILGLLFALGFAPNDLWFISILSLTYLYFLIRDSNKKELFLIGYSFGIGLWSLGISWLYVSIYFYGNLGFIASTFLTLLFIGIISIYSGLTLFLYSYLRFNSKSVAIFSLPIAWIAVEYLRSILFTGFPWLISGTMLANTPLDGWTPIIGAQGNTFLLILISSVLYQLVSNLQQSRSPLLLFILFSVLMISSYTLKNFQWTELEGVVTASVVQTNLELEEKWSTEGVIDTKNMIETAIDLGDKGEIIVFPETALIFSEKEIKDWLDYIDVKAKQKNITLLTGIIEREGNFKVRNRILGLGEANSYYDKVKLVPFGEFIPFENITGKFFDILGLKLTNTLPGEQIKTINAGNIRISASICYEIAFPGLIRKTASDSNLLVTISNDTWFGRSYGPIQHLEIAQNRALEHKKTLVRSTNSGISAFITKEGKIKEKQGYFEEKSLKNEIELYKGQTFYAKYGNLPLFSILSVILMYIIAVNIKISHFTSRK